MKEYIARIAQASRTELTVIIYEIIITDIKESQDAFGRQDLTEYTKSLKHAQKFLNELMGTLDYQYPISYRFMSLYLYVNKRIITAMFSKNPDLLESAVSVISKLKQSFAAISKEDKSGPVMKNTQQLYAGLTYGKGILNETYIDPIEHNRGFRA